MPWREVSLMDQRREFILLFKQADVNRRELCRRFGISSKTAYKWLARAGARGGCDVVRHPYHSIVSCFYLPPSPVAQTV